MRPVLELGFGLAFEALYDREGMAQIDRAFLGELGQSDIGLFNRLMVARQAPDEIEAKAKSDLITERAPHVEDFLGRLFGIESEIAALQAKHHELAPIYAVKRLFVQR